MKSVTFFIWFFNYQTHIIVDAMTQATQKMRISLPSMIKRKMNGYTGFLDENVFGLDSTMSPRRDSGHGAVVNLLPIPTGKNMNELAATLR